MTVSPIEVLFESRVAFLNYVDLSEFVLWCAANV